MTTYYGKYRGTVVDNVDPVLMGRLLVRVGRRGTTAGARSLCRDTADRLPDARTDHRHALGRAWSDWWDPAPNKHWGPYLDHR